MERSERRTCPRGFHYLHHRVRPYSAATKKTEKLEQVGHWGVRGATEADHHQSAGGR